VLDHKTLPTIWGPDQLHPMAQRNRLAFLCQIHLSTMWGRKVSVRPHSLEHWLPSYGATANANIHEMIFVGGLSSSRVPRMGMHPKSRSPNHQGSGRKGISRSTSTASILSNRNQGGTAGRPNAPGSSSKPRWM
jgi:hypothetical protein